MESASTPRRSAGHLRTQGYRVSPRRQRNKHSKHSKVHATLNATSFARHATSNVRVPCAANHAASITHHATYNAPHATYSCSTHNCQQRGSRTAVERAMLPPLNSMDPPNISATPPFCTPPPPSTSGPIGPPLRRVQLMLQYRRSPQTRTSRCRLTCVAHHHHLHSAHKRGASSLGEDDSIPPARCNVQSHYANTVDATEATCSGMHAACCTQHDMT
jgi:hypothetical protein